MGRDRKKVEVEGLSYFVNSKSVVSPQLIIIIMSPVKYKNCYGIGRLWKF